MSIAVPVTAFISWAHSGEDREIWTPKRVAEWEETVRGFADLLVHSGIDADIDLWHASDAVEWSKFGPRKVQESDFTIIAVSDAWRQRWEGTNSPTVGAGAVGEANTLRGTFEANQKSFVTKTVIAILPGADRHDLPPELSTLTRFHISSLDALDSGFEDLLRRLTGQPKYLRPQLGSVPVLGAEPPSISSPSSRMSAEAGDGQARESWFRAFRISADARKRLRRSGTGLSRDQVDRILEFRVSVPHDLQKAPMGTVRIVTGPLGSGKSEVADEWLQQSTSAEEAASPLPLWVHLDDLELPLEDYVSNRVDVAALSNGGINIVVDGLDERTDRSPSIIRQATDFVARWPRSTIVLTSRSPDNVDASLLIPIPAMASLECDDLMRNIAGHSISGIGQQLSQAATRPLFAILIAQHASRAEGVTGIPELIDLVVDDVVHKESGDLYQYLRRLAVETLRSGSPVDPSRFSDASVAYALRRSPLVSASGRRCSFSLATFEQWFAARALLEGEVRVSELLTSLDVFERWKYVLAIVLAAGEPIGADAVMTELIEWNPGAAAWVIREVERGGLTRRRPIPSSTQWEDAGNRLRAAFAATLRGLTFPLASTFDMFRMIGTSNLDELTLGIEIEGSRLDVGWTPAAAPGLPTLPPVVRLSEIFNGNRGMSQRMWRLPPGENWIWKAVQDWLASDITKGVSLAVEVVIASGDVPSATDEKFLAESHAHLPECGIYPGIEPCRPAIYPGPDLPPSGHPAEAWARFSTAQMHQRVQAIVAAAMTIYLELSGRLTARFGDTLAHRGLMPVQFYANMRYNPDEARGFFDLPGPTPPGLTWMLRPIGNANRLRPSPAENQLSISVNDDDRRQQILDDKETLYAAYRKYVEANPAYENFAGNFSIHTGSLGVFDSRPATQMAVEWLKEDLAQLGWMD